MFFAPPPTGTFRWQRHTSTQSLLQSILLRWFQRTGIRCDSGFQAVTNTADLTRYAVSNLSISDDRRLIITSIVPMV
jgi:hypothetical protein